MTDKEVIVNFSSPTAKFVMRLIGVLVAVVLSLAGIIYTDMRNDVSINTEDIRGLGDRGESEAFKELREQVRVLSEGFEELRERYAGERCKDLGGSVDYNTGFCKTEDGKENFRVQYGPVLIADGDGESRSHEQ